MYKIQQPSHKYDHENRMHSCTVLLVFVFAADCPPGSYGTMENGVATCNICPRDFYQPNPGQTSCIKCPEGFATTGQGAYDQKQCKGK